MHPLCFRCKYNFIMLKTSVTALFFQHKAFKGFSLFWFFAVCGLVTNMPRDSVIERKSLSFWSFHSKV